MNSNANSKIIWTYWYIRPKSRNSLSAWPSNKSHPEKRGTLAQQVVDYTGQTSIHGIFYLGEDGRTLFERL